MIDNIFYFKVISRIGGVETFLQEIARKYKDLDIVVYYDRADKDQLAKLSHYVKTQKRIVGQRVKCKRAFYNFNNDMIDDVDADEHIFVIHANFEELGYHPLLHPKVTRYVAVSKFAQREFKKYSGIDAELSYNPIKLDKPNKVMHLVSACRLDDEVKGGKRTLKLIQALDKYCLMHNRHYLWTIYTNNINFYLDSPNVALMKPRVDVREYIAGADWVLQLSNDMETYCYTTAEAIGYGVPIVTTPLSVMSEFDIPKDARIILNYDCSNVDVVAEQIMTRQVKPFKVVLPNDRWNELFIKGKSKYQEELKIMIKVKALKNFEKVVDNEVGRTRGEGEIFAVSKVRLEQLQAFEIPLIEVVEEEEKAVKKPNTKKAVK